MAQEMTPERLIAQQAADLRRMRQEHAETVHNLRSQINEQELALERAREEATGLAAAVVGLTDALRTVRLRAADAEHRLRWHTDQSFLRLASPEKPARVKASVPPPVPSVDKRPLDLDPTMGGAG